MTARDKNFEDDTPSIHRTMTPTERMIPMVPEHRTSGLSLAGCRNFQLYSAVLRVLIVVVPVNKWMEFWKVLWSDGSLHARNGLIVS